MFKDVKENTIVEINRKSEENRNYLKEKNQMEILEFKSILCKINKSLFMLNNKLEMKEEPVNLKISRCYPM